MKTLYKFAFLTAVLAVSAGAHAEDDFPFDKVGIRAGLNLSQIASGTKKIDYQESPFNEASYMTSGVFVGAYGYDEDEILRQELNLSMQGGELYMNDVRTKFTHYYINYAFLLEVRPWRLLFDVRALERFSIFVGPQLGYCVARNVTSADGKRYSGSEYNNWFGDNGMNGLKHNRWNFAAVAGVQYRIGDFLINAHYSYGFTRTWKPEKKPEFKFFEPDTWFKSRKPPEGSDVRGTSSRVLQIGIGYCWKGG